MKLTKLGLAIATFFSGVSYDATALDLYVDSKTQQIFAEPGPGRTKLGTFQQVEESNAQKSEVESQKAEIAKIKEDLAQKSNALNALDTAAKDPSLGKFHMDENGMKFETQDGNFNMQLLGYLDADAQVNENQSGVARQSIATQTTNKLADGMNLRRARLGVLGTLFHDFDFRFEYDFMRATTVSTAGSGLSSGSNYAGVVGGMTDAWFSWKGIKSLGVTIGQFKEPLSLEEATSSRYSTFIEQNMATNAFIDNNNVYKIGLGITYMQPRWTVQTSLQTEAAGGGTAFPDTSSTNANGNANRNNGSSDTAWGFSGRATTLLWYQDKTRFLHVGGWGSQRYPDNNYNTNGSLATNGGGPRFGAALDTNVDRSIILDTGSLDWVNSSGRITRQVSKFTRFGAESALVYGPFSAQGEYFQTNISGFGYANQSLNGAYGFASFFLTGESRNYLANGSWGKIKPNQNFTTSGGIGAWEIAAGYDYLNLNDGIIQGGQASSGKFGMTWYVNPNVKLMANFIHYLNINTANVNNAGPNQSGLTPLTNPSVERSRAFNGTQPDIFEMRAQMEF